MMKGNRRVEGIFLVALFILGNTILSFPSGADATSGIYALVVSLLPAVLVFGIYGKLLRDNTALLEGKSGKWLSVLLLIISFYGIVMCCRDYGLFIDTMRLPNTSLFVIAGVFVGLGFLLGGSQNKVLYLFAVVGFFVTAAVLVILLILSLPNIRAEYLTPALKPDITAAFRQGAGIFVHSFGQCLLLVFFLNKSKAALSRQYIGLGLGAGLLSLSFVTVLGVLGRVTADIRYPYIVATEMVNLGNGYISLEGLGYLVYFLCALIKTALLLKISLKIGSTLGRNFKRLLYILLPLSALFGVSRWGRGLFLGTAVNLIILGLETALPLVLLLKKQLTDKS